MDLYREEGAPDSPDAESDNSMDRDLDFKSVHGPDQSCLSLESNNSMHRDWDFKRAQSIPDRESAYESYGSVPQDWNLNAAQSVQYDSVPRRSAASLQRDWVFNRENVSKENQQSLEQSPLDSIFLLLEEKIMTFVKDELKKFHRVLSLDECLVNDEDEQKNEEAFLKITLDFLRRMDQKQLAHSLQSRSNLGVYQSKLKSSLKHRYHCVFEGLAKAGNPTLLNQIFTDLYITEGGAAGVNQEHEVRQIETISRKSPTETTITCEDIFKGPAQRREPVRTVLTKGVAGIGKTVLTQKFTLDWAEGKANQSIQFLFPFTFRQLNVLRDRQFSLEGLLQHFFSESRGLCVEDLQVVFIFDGLDECRLPLDFTKVQALTDSTESTSLHVLLVNLIRGTLLPTARLWITTRPAAANQIPPECVSMVTEVRGFADPQKEQYFRKRITDEQQATAIISHIRTSRSLYIMCHIPVFCWITATVLLHVMKTRDQLPQTLTEMYIHFLVVQAKVKSLKFDDQSETSSTWTPETRKMVESLAKLAFVQLQIGNLIFYESDLRECGLDVREASVYSGVFTEVFREEPGLYQDKVYCFVHLSVQEFLAALHVHLTFYKSGINLLFPEQNLETQRSTEKFYESAVDLAVQSPNGHWDLFLRFLLGLSLPTNQILLHGQVTNTGSGSQTSTGLTGRQYTEMDWSGVVLEETALYIKLKINNTASTDRVFNLFHCLNELNDRSLVEYIQNNLRLGQFSKKMSPAQWSALAFILLSTDKELDEFDLNKYFASEEVLLRLLPVVKASNKAILTACSLGEEGCEALSLVLSSQSLSLKELDLSHNSFRDSGLELLASGLHSPHCTLETLRLQYCCLSAGSGGLLSSVLTRSSRLRHLDLSNNDLRDSGVEQLSTGLRSPDCKLQTLRLSGCMISGKGCSSLSSALNSNTSSLLKELDLSYNYAALPGLKLVTSVEKDLLATLKHVRLTPCGEQFLKPGQKKYFCKLMLDPNTAYRKLKISDDNRTVIFLSEEQLCPDHPDRFDWYPQVLCSTGLTGRHYWEVEWSGVVSVAVTTKEIQRKGDDTCNVFGQNGYSWRLWCSEGRLSVCENKEERYLDTPPSGAFGQVAVYVDCPAGFLSFYRVLGGQLIHLHTFHTNFTEPLFAAFGFGSCYSSATVTTK